ncbi:hypothetical protein MASR2M15_17170 [Anaerolineales bacterium]
MTEDEQQEDMTVEALQERVATGRAEFAALWQDLPEAAMTLRPGVQEDWSVKDLIAHIVWWERYLMERVDVWLKGDPPLTTGDDYNAINARILAENRDRDLADVLADFDQSYQALQSQMRRLSDTQLNDRQSYATKGARILDYYAGNTFGHYEEHSDDLKRFCSQYS